MGEFIRNRGGGAWEHRKSGLAGAEAGKYISPLVPISLRCRLRGYIVLWYKAVIFLAGF